MNKFPIELIKNIYSFNNEIKSLTNTNKLLYSYRKYFNISCHEFCLNNFNSEFILTKIYGITDMNNMKNCKYLEVIDELIYDFDYDKPLDGLIMAKMKNLTKLTILSDDVCIDDYNNVIKNNTSNDQIMYLTLKIRISNILFPKNLIYLNIDYMDGPLSFLPESLKYLVIGHYRDDINDLPKNLLLINIKSTYGLPINYLPDKLVHLNLGNALLNKDDTKDIIYLPDTITHLQVNIEQILYNIPKNIKFIDFNKNKPSNNILRNLPKTLRHVRILKKYSFLKNIYENIKFDFI